MATRRAVTRPAGLPFPAARYPGRARRAGRGPGRKLPWTGSVSHSPLTTAAWSLLGAPFPSRSSESGPVPRHRQPASGREEPLRPACVHGSAVECIRVTAHGPNRTDRRRRRDSEVPDSDGQSGGKAFGRTERIGAGATRLSVRATIAFQQIGSCLKTETAARGTVCDGQIQS